MTRLVYDDGPAPWRETAPHRAAAFLSHHGTESFVLLVLAVAIIYAVCMLARPDEQIEHPEEA